MTAAKRLAEFPWRTLPPAIILLACIGFIVLWRAGLEAGQDNALLKAALSIAVLSLTALMLYQVARGQRKDRELGSRTSLLLDILELAPATIWAKNEQGGYVFNNEGAASPHGLGHEEFTTRPPIDAMTAEQARQIEEWDQAARAQPEATISGEMVVEREGEALYIRSLRRLSNIGGHFMMVGAAMDVTPLRRAEEALRSEMRQREAAQAELRQAQKMEAIGKLTGGIAHDFNNLLTSVLGNLELAKRQLPEGRARQLLEHAERSAQRGANLIERLLAFARRQHLNPQPLDLNRLIRNMHDLLHHSIGSLIRIEMVLTEPLWPALADANQVETAILNIAVNARDAMPGGGTLTIRTANVEGGRADLPPVLTAGDYIVITISDTGSGMSEEVRAKAFDPFFTTKEFGRGSGLGLSQVYGMAQQSGGTATIESQIGEGTTVSLFLPRAAGLAATATNVPAEGAS